MDTTFPTIVPASINIAFTYEVIISGNSEIFKNLSALENLSEMHINSGKFPDAHACMNDVTDLLDNMSKQLGTITGNQYVIATELNPIHAIGGEHDDWEGNMISKMFLTEKRAFKKASLKECFITAILRASPSLLAMPEVSTHQ